MSKLTSFEALEILRQNNKDNELLDIIQDELEYNELTIHSLEQKVHTIDYDLGFLLEHIEVEEIKDIGMIEPDYKMHMSFPPFNYRQNCMRVHSMQCQWRERNKK